MSKYDNWDNVIDLNDLLRRYIQIEQEQNERPVIRDLPEPPEKEREFVGGDEPRQRFFTPSLQHLRNNWTYEQLPRKYDIRKLAILGCGELSFEKYALKDLADRGVWNIVSVDVDEKALSCGLEYMTKYLNHNEEYTMKRTSHPIHIEVYKGDVSTPSPVLSNVDVAISTEVIEHMPLEKATELLKAVLEKIRPRLYILSTPNFEYNVAFNRTTGFRHDDHHFEFTREQFKKWLSENIHPPYSYEISFVGQLEGYGHLDGATQFAYISREGTECHEITENEGTYEKVGDLVYRTSYYRLFESVVVGAFRRFLDDFTFDREQMQTIGSVSFWRISIERILEYRTTPTIEIEEDGEISVMMMLTRLFSSKVFNSEDPETKRSAISLPATSTKKDLIKTIDGIFE